MTSRDLTLVLLVSGLILVSTAISRPTIPVQLSYTPLELDGMTVEGTGVAGLDWFIHNVVTVTSSSGPLNPIPVRVLNVDWSVKDGESYSLLGGPAALPTLKEILIANAEYLWVDSSGNVKAHSDIGWGIDNIYGNHLEPSFSVNKLTSDAITVALAGVTIYTIPASNSTQQQCCLVFGWNSANSELKNIIPLNYTYRGGWTPPTDLIYGSQSGPLAQAAANTEVVEHQNIAWSGNAPGDFLLPLYFANANDDAQTYLIIAQLPSNARCDQCPPYADIGGALKLTSNQGTVNFFLTRLHPFAWTVSYSESMLAELAQGGALNSVTGSMPTIASSNSTLSRGTVSVSEPFSGTTSTSTVVVTSSAEYKRIPGFSLEVIVVGFIVGSMIIGFTRNRQMSTTRLKKQRAD